MKKLIYSMFALAMTAMTFTSCEDVPAPYELPWDGTILKEAFTGNSYGDFEIITPEGESWSTGSTYIQGSGYNSTTKKNTISRSYLISPDIDLSKITEAYLQFKYIFRYASNEGENKVLITDDYTGNPENTEWTDITGKLNESADWNTWSTYAKAIPEAFLGKKNVRIAFFFSGTEKSSRTWELKLLYVKQGTPPTDPEPEPEPLGEGEYLNESFEKNFGRFSAYTVKGQPWIISYSTAKASGYTGTNIESEAYLVSIPLDLTKSAGAHLEFETILGYKDNDGDVKVLITDNFNADDPNASDWTDITGDTAPWVTGDWNTFAKYIKDIPAKFIGKNNVRVALYYNATNSSSKTWEVRKLVMREGNVPGTYTNPYKVADALKVETAGNAFVKGYIVGYVDDSDQPQLKAEGAALKHKLLIADKADETNTANMMTVYLNMGAVRNNLSLNKNPANLHKQALFYGALGTKLSEFPAVNNTSYVEIDGNSYGTKPE